MSEENRCPVCEEFESCCTCEPDEERGECDECGFDVDHCTCEEDDGVGDPWCSECEEFESCCNCDPVEPDDEDWVTEDYITFCQHNYGHRYRIVVPDGEDWREALKARMEKDQFWPGVWYLSDHGNWHLIRMGYE